MTLAFQLATNDLGRILLECVDVARSAPTDLPESGASEAALSSATPVTASNFLDHPKIKAIQAEVDAIEAANLTVSVKGPTKETCDETLSTGTDAVGRGRKFVAVEQAFSKKTTTYYFNESGKAHLVSRLEEEPPSSINGGVAGIVVESRVYFYVEGSSAAPTTDDVRLLEVERSATWPLADAGRHPPDLGTAPFRPTSGPLVGCVFPTFIDPRVMIDPAKVFDEGCVAPEAAPSVIALLACSSQ